MLLRCTTFLSLMICCFTGFSQSWTALADFPGSPRDDAVHFKIGNKVYCGTGLLPGFFPSNNFSVFNFNGFTWSSIASLPANEARQYATAFSYNGKGYLFGGIVQGQYENDLWMYNPQNDSWTETDSLPAAGRAGCCSFVANNKVYIIGGKNSNNDALSEVWCYNFNTQNWTQKNDMPFGTRWRAACTLHNNKAYLSGGRNDQNMINDSLYEYDFSNDTWTQVSVSPFSGRIYGKMVSFNQNLIFVFGEDSTGTFHKDVWYYNTSSNQWSQGLDLPDKSRRAGLAFTNNTSLFYTTGLDENLDRQQDTWILDYPTKINEQNNASEIKIYPNPFKNRLNITNNHNLKLNKIQITNALGQVIKTYNANAQERYTLITESWKAGIYFLNVSFVDNAAWTTKMIIKNKH